MGFVSTAKLPSVLLSTDGNRSNPEHVKHPPLSCMDKLNKANLLLREGTQLIPETIRNYTKQISLGDLSYLGDPPGSSAKKNISLSYRLVIISELEQKLAEIILFIHLKCYNRCS